MKFCFTLPQHKRNQPEGQYPAPILYNGLAYKLKDG